MRRTQCEGPGLHLGDTCRARRIAPQFQDCSHPTGAAGLIHGPGPVHILSPLLLILAPSFWPGLLVRVHKQAGVIARVATIIVRTRPSLLFIFFPCFVPLARLLFSGDPHPFFIPFPVRAPITAVSQLRQQLRPSSRRTQCVMASTCSPSVTLAALGNCRQSARQVPRGSM